METTLAKTQEELVAIGASIAANCMPCLSYHVGAARKAGLTDAEIAAAVVVAQSVKETPARLILDAARRLLGTEAEPAPEPAKSACCS